VAFRYSFGGLSVNSDAPLEGLREAPELDRANGAADIGMTLAAGAAPSAQEILFQWPGRYGLSLGRLGSDWLFSSRLGAAFRICPDGRRIVAYAGDRSPDIGFMDVLARRVLPRVALLHGAIGIHAAAVANATGALLLSAPSGFGKSTLAAVMSRRPGWTALSDDVSLLGSSGGQTLVLPAASGICLRPDSRRALGLRDRQCRSMPGYEDKLWFRPDPGPEAAARPLSAFVVLIRRADVDAPTLKPLAPLEAFMLATNQLIHFNPKASADGAIAEMMERLSRALDGVPSYVLACPDRFDALGPGADLLAGLAQ
jgi:hypothetical protein